MRFFLDESADARLGRYLQQHGHDVRGIVPDLRAGLPDEEVLAIATREEQILIIRDTGFGRLVFVDLQPHAGVILLRLGPLHTVSTITDRVDDVLRNHSDDLNRFLVVTQHLIRVR